MQEGGMRDRFSFGLKMRILVFSENLFHPPANFKNPKFCGGYRVSYRLKLSRSLATTSLRILEVCLGELALISGAQQFLTVFRISTTSEVREIQVSYRTHLSLAQTRNSRDQSKKISISQICEITKTPNQEFGHTPQGRWKGVAGILS